MPLLLGLQSAALVFILVGAQRRHRLAISWLFAAYLATGATHKAWQLVQGVDSWLAWLAVDLLQGMLCLGAIVEVAARAFHRGLPGGRQQLAWRLLIGLALGLAIIVLWGINLNPTSPGELYDALVEVSRRLALTTLVLCTILLGFAANNWTLDPWHREIVVGVWVYNAARAILSPRFGVMLPPWWPVAVYCLLLSAWTWAAWRPPLRREWAPDVRRLVWPWRA